MSYAVALTSPEQTALNAGGHTVQRYLSVFQPTVIYTSTILAIAYLSGAAWPALGFTLNATVPTTVRRGMTMKIVSSGGVVRGYYRVTIDGDGVGPSLNNGILAEQDPGLLNIGYRTSGPVVGDTVIVYNRYDLWGTNPYFSTALGNIWTEDSMSYSLWNGVERADNTYPRLAVNIGKHRSQFVDAGQTYATMTFSAALIFWNSSIVTYAWTIPGSWTVTAGNASSASFTAQVPAGCYVLELDVTHDATKHSIGRRVVWVHDTGANAPIPILDIPNDTRDRTGRQMTIAIADDDLASIPDGAMVNYFEAASWGGTTVPTATTNFTGWITREGWRINQGVRRGDLSIIGPADCLKLVPGFSQYYAYNAAPSTFQEIYYNGLNYIIFDLLWKRAANILTLFDFTAPYNTGTNTFLVSSGNWALLSWPVPQASNLLEQIQALCKSSRFNFGVRSDGGMIVAQHPSETDPSTRGANIVVRDYLTTNRYAWPIAFERRRKPEYRRTVVRGFCFGASMTALIGEAPFGALGQGPNEDIVNDYITQSSTAATAQTEVNLLAAQIQAGHNNPLPDVPFNIPDNRDVYEPAEMYFVQSDVPADQALDNTGWTAQNGVPLRVVKKHNIANGTAQLELHLEMETANVKGGTITVP